MRVTPTSLFVKEKTNCFEKMFGYFIGNFSLSHLTSLNKWINYDEQFWINYLIMCEKCKSYQNENILLRIEKCTLGSL